MTFRFPIPIKLLVLAGVPVVGALLLAAFIVLDARSEAQRTAALGSIEDLAHLSAQIGKVVEQLQYERNEAAIELVTPREEARELKKRFQATEQAEQRLMEFLASRHIANLPPRLARDLKQAGKQLNGLDTVRDHVLDRSQDLSEMLEYYKATNRSLISATAALAQLSNDGELLRAISALVGVLEIKERASQEHAVLAHVFAVKSFPPGIYKELVTLTTEERDYVNALELQASDAVMKRFRVEQGRPESQRAGELRQIALNTLDDDFRVDAAEWSVVQARRIEGFRALEMELNEAVRSAALAKVAAAAGALRLSYGLGAGIVITSVLLAGFMARGISRSVLALAATAERVRVERDFTLRAKKTSEDEIGQLADAFNEMLAGLKERDEELAEHRNNLERLVEDRTRALKKRNAAMRLVLDNVDQGLVTIEQDGMLSLERSRAFHAWFGESTAEEPFQQRIAGHDPRTKDALGEGWAQVVDGILPLEVSLDQLPKRLEKAGRHYALEYKGIQEGLRDSNPAEGEASFQGALLVVTDVTEEIARLKRDAEQRETIAVFERLVDDRSTFFQFLRECQALMRSVTEEASGDVTLLMRAVHTLKGSCGSFGVTSVADVAHRLEDVIAETGTRPPKEDFADLEQAFQSFYERARRLSGASEETVVDITAEELDQLLEAARCGMPHAELGNRLEKLKNERVIVRLRRAADQLRSLSGRLGKGDVIVDVQAPTDVRLPGERWAPFWTSFVHLLRNAVDHGLESPEERLSRGKRANGRLTLTAHLDGPGFAIEIADDGRGIDWERVRERARERGLPHATQSDLTDALFTDGVSTKDQVTAISGRGVGLSAVREAVRALDGTITVTTRPGRGTTFRFRFPISAMRADVEVGSVRHPAPTAQIS